MKTECNLNYDFEVAERDVYFEGKGRWGFSDQRVRTKDHKAIVNLDEDKLLSIVSEKYQLIEHKEIVNMTRQILATRGADITEDIVLTKNGARMFYHLNYGTPVVLEDSSGLHDVDKVSHGLRITNSYDGSMRIFVEGTGLRHICSNQLTFPFDQIKGFLSASLMFGDKVIGRKHVGLTSLTGFENLLEMWLDVQEHAPEMFNNIKAKDLVPGDFEKFDKIIAKLPEIYRNRIVDTLADTGAKNVWDLYNVATEATTHVREENKSIETLRNHSLVVAKVLSLGQ